MRRPRASSTELFWQKHVMRLYVGKFAGRQGSDEHLVRAWCESQIVGGGPVGVFGVNEVVATAMRVAARKTYVDDAALVAMKVLAAA
jgi:hypothetical protein